MFGFKFLGNTHVPHHKNTAETAPVKMTPPTEVLIPTSQHIGAPATPIVKVGDEVKVGQLIAQASGYVSAPVHASVSGKVVKIENCLFPDGREYPSIRIENDGLMTLSEDVVPPAVSDLDSLIEAARACGLVGLGGAGFPTSVKLDALKKGNIDTIVINAAECEPYITADNRLLVERMDDALLGIRILMKTLGVSHATLAIESNKEEAIEMLRERLDGTGIMLRILRTKYPQGSEKHIIRAVTGREVPPGKLPGDIGCAVFNPASCAAIYDAVAKGLPLISRFVTISGSAIGNPQNLRVRIGTPISCLISAAGGYSLPPQRIIIGGPMMGTAQYTTEVPVLKTCNSVLVFGENEGLHAGSAICIRCGKCVSVCPMRLQPLYIRLYGEKGEYEYCEKKLNVRDCIECGACSYKCPGHLPLVQSIRFVKQRLGPVKKS